MCKLATVIALVCGLGLLAPVAQAQAAQDTGKQKLIDACWSLPAPDSARSECHGFVILMLRARETGNRDGMSHWFGMLMENYPEVIAPEPPDYKGKA